MAKSHAKGFAERVYANSSLLNELGVDEMPVKSYRLTISRYLDNGDVTIGFDYTDGKRWFNRLNINSGTPVEEREEKDIIDAIVSACRDVGVKADPNYNVQHRKSKTR